MRKKLIGNCPVCNERLFVTEMTCKECKTQIKGDFTLSKFDYLSQELQEFALVFLKNAGNIKGVEKELNISYPTVKRNLDELINALGFTNVSTMPEEKMTRQEILEALKKKEISFEAAEKLLKEIE